MPFYDVPGGGTRNPLTPTVKVTAVTSTGELSDQSRTVSEAAEESEIQVKALPQAIRTVADLPTNAKPGMFFTSRLNPTAIYIFGYDNKWRAWNLLDVA